MHRYDFGMAASPAKQVEFDSEPLDRLHDRRPEMSDREMLESVAKMTLGRGPCAAYRSATRSPERRQSSLASKLCMRPATNTEPAS